MLTNERETMKRFSILVDFNKASQTTRIQLRSETGSRPGRRAGLPGLRQARVYVNYFNAHQAVSGMRHFTDLREELEREVN